MQRSATVRQCCVTMFVKVCICLFLVAYTAGISGARVSAPSDDTGPAHDFAFRGCAKQGRVSKDYNSIRGWGFHAVGGHSWVKLSCHECEQGYVLLRGRPPLQSSNWTKKDFAKAHITIMNHCSEFDGDGAKKFVMIRHGQSKWNHVTEKRGVAAQSVGLLKKYEDSPLSQAGLRQAQRFAALLRDVDDRIEQDAEKSPAGANVHNALEELDGIDLAETLIIKRNGEVLSDDILLQGISNHSEELEVLLGKKCGESVFVTSQLVRAMDTFNIAMLPARLNCDFFYEISSNLQEFEHNRDCEARTPAGERPTCTPKQRDSYIAVQMEQTLRYVEEQYSTSKIQRFTRNLNSVERQRIIGNSRFIKETIQNEISTYFGVQYDNVKYVLFGGHSIWFRLMFRFFGNQQDPVCKQLGETKIANVGVVSAILRKVHDTDTPYALVDCKWIHLGPSDEFKYEFHPAVMSAAEPDPVDFRFGAKEIAGWRCCCSESPAHKGCLMVRSANGKTKCKDVATWSILRGSRKLISESQASTAGRWKARYGWQDDSSRPPCVIASDT